MQGEMVSDSIDDALDGDDLEEETDDLTNQVLDEIGVDTAAQVGFVYGFFLGHTESPEMKGLVRSPFSYKSLGTFWQQSRVSEVKCEFWAFELPKILVYTRVRGIGIDTPTHVGCVIQFFAFTHHGVEGC